MTKADTTLLIATSNMGKLLEFQSLLAALPVRLRSLTEFPGTTGVDETGSTFTENAVLKANSYAAQTGCLTLADDSGLEVEALGGAPGVLSARYAGEGATAAERNDKLLAELSSTGDTQRRARFVCVIALANPADGILQTSTGICEGKIAYAPRGANGFGYDPLFIPDGYTQSFGELSEEIKQQISHRARALAAARDFLQDLLRPRA